MSDMYLWIKTLHILAIISWMAGLLYLPRLFVYHCGAKAGSVQSETFKVMERRLLFAIMTPAMIIAWASGLWLANEADFFHDLLVSLQIGARHSHDGGAFAFLAFAKIFAKDINIHP